MNKAIDKIKSIIETNQLKNESFRNFVLQGGAGSGKTESLKDIIVYISEKYPEAKIACITHTNLAADEIKSRINNEKYKISTIHSFLNELIKNYKRNIKSVIPHIFYISKEVITNHDEYKKRYSKFAKRNFQINNEASEKVTGKREYDKQTHEFNTQLLRKIDDLNKQIQEIISSKDHDSIQYNETKFDSFGDLTFSHDSLLVIAHRLCKEHELLAQIVSDRFDFIFIDEYQDTNPLIIDFFVKQLPENKKTTIGLFGDSMQGIYDDGIGDVESLIKKKLLVKVNKEDNFRCSDGVITFINQLRDDEIKQKLALKKEDKIDDRNGKVKLFYKIVGKKPNAYNSQEEKNKYLDELNKLIKIATDNFNDVPLKTLMLTNKSISLELGFSNLYKVFDDRFVDVKDEIEKELEKIQIIEIINLLADYKNKNYNQLLIALKKNGFTIGSLKDKEIIVKCLEKLSDGTKSLNDALEFCYKNKLIKKSERAANYMKQRKIFLDEYSKNKCFIKLEKLFLGGINTVTRLKKEDIEILQEEFDEFSYNFKKKLFYEKLFSENIKLQESIEYFDYLNEESSYITMHKTKGSGIENVVVVLDEYFWTKYNFKSIYDDSVEEGKRLKNQKLFYVACSRTIKDLSIVRLIEDEHEEKILLEYFKNCEPRKIN